MHLDFSSECSNVDPPAPIECINALWLNQTCLELGDNYPEKLVGDNRTQVDALSVQ